MNDIGRAEACANIALAKYWGKSDRGDNLTAVPSLSLTLDALRTRTEVRFDEALERDEASMGGQPVQGRPLDRVVDLLSRIRALSDEKRHARIISHNNFPTAAGLASSASGFAALATAASAAAGAKLSLGEISSQARKSSASAARSLFEGFAVLEREADEGEPLLPASHWDVSMVVAVIGSGPKAIGSTGGMLNTKATSPYYGSWEKEAPAVFLQIKEGVMARDFEKVADGMEHSTRMMHATMITSVPPVLYLKGPTVELMHQIASARSAGTPVAYTMDAGPNVKVLTLGSHIDETVRMLEAQPGVERTIVCRPGPAASLLHESGSLESAERQDGWQLPAFFSPAEHESKR